MTNPGARRSIRVLIVEDDDSLREAIARCLTRADFAVEAVASGADALEAAREDPPDAAIIDVLLPDSGGLGVANALRREPGTAAVPIVFMTALSLPTVREMLSPAPVLFKPFTQRQLVTSIREATRAA